MKKIIQLLVITALITTAIPCQASKEYKSFKAIFAKPSSNRKLIVGKVKQIIDGDTINVISKGKFITVRLAAIDAPENKQIFGRESRNTLRALIKNRIVNLSIVNDNNRRIVAHIFYKGRHINAEMVRNGFAWVYSSFKRNGKLFAYQRTAKKYRKGLWGLPKKHIIKPSQWKILYQKKRLKTY
ncbi:MAG: hypothetical protein HON94_15045 [Methylococcales bacterium]|jgi:micrococcal nuclease|nr:hypothetical protein [Methylococcales bacterium]MBT7411150.1 hypothetical protein [Methylococcales bacterium]